MKAGELATIDSREAGFSLFEVLVALLLVSVMAISLAAMAGQFRQIVHNTNRNLELAALQSATRHMANLVEQAEVLPLESDEHNAGMFRGGTQELQFVATVRIGSFEKSLRTIKFDLRDGLGVIQSNRLRRRGESRNSSDVSDILILDDVQALEFRYLDWDDATELSIWRESWGTADRLPIAISVSLTKLDDTKRLLTSSAIAWLKPQ
jgi:prepilin-type N-terminal cleavage/methylation domain-containing protein